MEERCKKKKLKKKVLGRRMGKRIWKCVRKKKLKMYRGKEIKKKRKLENNAAKCNEGEG